MEELEKTEEQRITEELASDAAFKKANPEIIRNLGKLKTPKANA